MLFFGLNENKIKCTKENSRGEREKKITTFLLTEESTCYLNIFFLFHMIIIISSFLYENILLFTHQLKRFRFNQNKHNF